MIGAAGCAGCPPTHHRQRRSGTMDPYFGRADESVDRHIDEFETAHRVLDSCEPIGRADPRTVPALVDFPHPSTVRPRFGAGSPRRGIVPHPRWRLRLVWFDLCRRVGQGTCRPSAVQAAARSALIWQTKAADFCSFALPSQAMDARIPVAMIAQPNGLVARNATALLAPE